MVLFNSASNISFASRFQIDTEIELYDKPCTIIEEDCTPTFPAIAATNGVKKNKVPYCSIASPKLCETFTAIKLPISAKSNQGNRALVNSQILSSASTSCEIPASI